VLDLSQWRTVRFERRDHVVKAYVDDLTTPVWTYRGSSETLRDMVKQVVPRLCPVRPRRLPRYRRRWWPRSTLKGQDP
jgi:hypothetical protein